SFPIIRSIPKDHDLDQYNEILLCGTGRGVAQLSALPERGWTSSSSATFSQIRSIYEQLIKPSDA
ncbi:MAG: hypothetical protein ACKVJ1_06600, partial [Verrucomicrobiia bacterium]